MPRRFYLPQSLEAPGLRLTGAEANHLRRVLRYQAGDEVTLFDGRGTEARARIVAIADDAVELSVLERKAADDLPRVSVTLASAVPKGERFDWLVEKGTELGVDRLVPLITARSIVNPGAGKLDRLRRTIIEASKQCGRSRLMELADPMPWDDFLASATASAPLCVADPSGEPFGLPFAGNPPAALVVAVGPEGGFTADELVRAADRGARLVSLGSSILRIETAALALAVLARSCFAVPEGIDHTRSSPIVADSR
jgi:16S rRNA (uracil1498-N3)-methyltransferase